MADGRPDSSENPPDEPDPVDETVRIVVGLGNPGARYAMTRHNAGFMVADVLADRLGVSFDLKLEYSVAARVEAEGVEAWIVKPQCYMNRSGLAVREVLSRGGDAAAGILVAYDDFHLPLGRIRFRASGSAGGQNGVKSVIEVLGTEEFGRLRVGIGPAPVVEDSSREDPAGEERRADGEPVGGAGNEAPWPGLQNPADYVLSVVPEVERDSLREALDRATDGAHDWLRTGDVRECMNRYNGSAPRA